MRDPRLLGHSRSSHVPLTSYISIMVARPLMKNVSNSSNATCSKQRLWLWGGLVSAMALVSFFNLFESFELFQLPMSTSSSSTEQSGGTIESIDATGLQMYPFGIQPGVHHRIQTKFQGKIKNIRNTPIEKWSPTKQSKDECHARDYGVLQQLINSSRQFCSGTNSNSPYTFYHAPKAGLSATILHNFTMDIRGAEVAKDIESLSDDGSGHDPRFRYMPDSTFCNCAEPQDRKNGAPNIWKDLFVDGPGDKDPNCKEFLGDTGDKLALTRAVVLVRKDDHNPFFQISGILNAWIMMQTIGWERNITQLVTLDRALPAPVDELRHALLGSGKPIVEGEVFQNRVVHFESALLVPYEITGPLMSHLDDHQPCYDNDMIANFRDEALQSMAVTPHNVKTDSRRCLVTVISRRPYGGRRVQRVWQNEDEILQRMREEYQDGYRYGECEFQSLEFTTMTMHDQMRVIQDSDVVIGMHGAGMVNVLWTRPETLVIEIFPRRRFRWGYRNICQYIGCKWYEFRRGRDIQVHSSDPNDYDKHIPYPEWKSFFDPLFRDVIDNLEQKIEGE